uniref:Uncharacterized protein n=1 Tax=Panagrolaimus sp. JU765 TaxID=591449 RepID=A0AC34R1Y8_9BILA
MKLFCFVAVLAIVNVGNAVEYEDWMNSVQNVLPTEMPIEWPISFGDVLCVTRKLTPSLVAVQRQDKYGKKEWTTPEISRLYVKGFCRTVEAIQECANFVPGSSEEELRALNEICGSEEHIEAIACVLNPLVDSPMSFKQLTGSSTNDVDHKLFKMHMKTVVQSCNAEELLMKVFE